MQHLEVTGSSSSTIQGSIKNRRLFHRFAMTGVPFVTAAVFLFAVGRSHLNRNKVAYCSSSNYLNADGNVRTRQTPADMYFQKHKELPRPSKVHTTLPDLAAASKSKDSTAESHYCAAASVGVAKNILIIGDVHGCYEELIELHDKAVQENNGPFSYVILVGDLCNKGPHSAKVIRHVRLTPNWYSVRGNHDDGALSAALGHKKSLKKAKYAWVKEGMEEPETANDSDKVVLSDDDINWLSELPYTITIPREYTGDDEDTIVVHAGFIPDKDLHKQDIENMITIRDIRAKCDDNGNFKHFKPHEKGKSKALVASSLEEAKTCDNRVTWASAWFGPQRVVFGHNAKRRLQLYPGHWAIGLDTGAVYGGELTGLILPGRKLVSIQTFEHSPVTQTAGEEAGQTDDDAT
ncbi:serine/threonine protein phosphatase [Nitzschia inconspicua]|uniref:Serine/threonine protein phosphatase n=1 Tax=Nitzschia inconspicua TaxID=303405 RepID=A0A9K3LMP0_9STRA|nr:serine/threonine protein phosphatase [Nitzschia inconspicua]